MKKISISMHQYSHTFPVGACTGLYKPVRDEKVATPQAKQAMSKISQVEIENFISSLKQIIS
jgi:hypothetical protein